MANGMLSGLDVLGMTPCFACNSYNCHHVLQGQQQMSQNRLADYYNSLYGAHFVSSDSQQTRAYVPEKKINKLLLLLR